MPKIINDLKSTILNTAVEIFNEDGFKGFSLRKIASRCDIAVGTLYNYYPGKKELMYAVFDKLWLGTYEVLEDYIEKNKKKPDLFSLYIEKLHEEMKTKKGIGRDLMALELQKGATIINGIDIMTSTPISKLQNKQLKKVIKYSFNIDDSKLENIKNIDIFTRTALLLAMTFSGDNKQYNEFLKDLVSSYICNQ